MNLFPFMPLLLILFATAIAAIAQEPEPELAKIELFTGYAYLRTDSEHGRTNLNGWTVSVEGNVNRTVALVADFDGLYRRNQSSHSALVGPKFTTRRRRFAPFVDALAGVVREAQEEHAHYGFGMSLGGGVDYEINRRFSIRIAQLDYEYSRVEELNHHSVRFATGVVIKFGAK